MTGALESIEASGTSSISTFQSPGLPSPATVLTELVGGWFVGMVLKSNARSAADNRPAINTNPSNNKRLCMYPQIRRMASGGKCLRPAQDR